MNFFLNRHEDNQNILNQRLGFAERSIINKIRLFHVFRRATIGMKNMFYFQKGVGAKYMYMMSDHTYMSWV